MGFHRRQGASGLERRLRLHHLPALHLRGGSALPHPVGLQPQAAAVAARRAPEEEVQALGADVAKGDGLGTRGWLVMLSKPNIYKGFLTKQPKTPFSRQSQLVNQHEPPFIELRGAHFLSSEATALVEVASPLSEVQINCEHFCPNSFHL